MSNHLRIATLAVSVGLLLIVLELVRRRKLTEEYSFLWIVFAAGLLVLSVQKEMLGRLAAWLDLPNPSVVLILAVTAVVFAALYQSVIVSRQRQQIERLIEETAILSAEVRDLQLERHESAPTPRPASPPISALSRERGFRADAESPREVVARAASHRSDPRR